MTALKMKCFSSCTMLSVRGEGSMRKIATRQLLRSFLSTTVTTEIERKFIFNNAIVDYCESNCLNKREILMNDVYFDNRVYDLTTRDMWLRQRNDKLELKWPMLLASKNDGADHQSPEALVGLDFYQEATDLAKIADVLHKSTCLLVKFPFANCTAEENIVALEAAGIQPFGTILTHRMRYNLCMDLPARFGANSKSAGRNIKMFVDIDTVNYILPKGPPGCTSSTSERTSEALLMYQIGEVEFDFSANSNTATATSNSHTHTSSSEDGAELSDTDQASNAAIMQHVFRVMGIEHAPVRGKVLEYLARFRPDHLEALRKSGQLASKGL